MTSAPTSTDSLRTVAAGSPDGDLWLAGWFGGPGDRGVVVVAAGAAAEVRDARLAPGDEGWELAGEGLAVALRAAGEPVARAQAQEGEGEGESEQPVQVSGQVSVGGQTRTVELVGRHGERHDVAPGDALESIRELSAWFGPGETVAVSAVRPRKHKGHDADRVRAGVADPQTSSAIVDPRMSATYSTDGRPLRVGLELWPDDDDLPAVRLAGEASGPSIDTSHGDWELTVTPLRCHSRGRDGAGVYVLARLRPDRR